MHNGGEEAEEGGQAVAVGGLSPQVVGCGV